MSRKLKFLASLGVAALTLVGCSDFERETGKEDRGRTDEAHKQLEKSQPAKTLDYSPTRETINFWVETWNEPGKLSYVYLQNPDGEMLGYYVLEGLPVSYCAQISPGQKLANPRMSDSSLVPAAANDGAYYTGGGSCNTYYGKDATTGAFIEYTAGLGINVLLFDEPLDQFNGVEPLGQTSIEDVE